MLDLRVHAAQQVEHQVVGHRALGDLALDGAEQGLADLGVDLDDHGLALEHEEDGRARLGRDHVDVVHLEGGRFGHASQHPAPSVRGKRRMGAPLPSPALPS